MKNWKEFNENKQGEEVVDKYVKDLSKLKKIIKSCKTEAQTRSADNAFDLWKKKWAKLRSQIHNYDFNTDIDELDDLLKDKYKSVM